MQGAAAGRSGRPVHQGRVRHRPGRAHRDLPGGPDRAAAPGDAGGDGLFGLACASCPLAAQCTTARGGRTIYVGPYEAQLAAARSRQCDPDWAADYRATRPKVERKIAHLMRRRHGGRRARVRGQVKVAAFSGLRDLAVSGFVMIGMPRSVGPA